MNEQLEQADFDPDNASIEELRAHIARKRAAIDANLGELERRVQPDYLAEHLVGRGRELLSGQSGSIIREFGQIARDNPLGTALTCFGLALLAKGYLDANGAPARGGRDKVSESDSTGQHGYIETDQAVIRRQLREEQRYVPSYTDLDAVDHAIDDDHMDSVWKGAAIAAGIGAAVGGYVAYTKRETEPVY